MRSLKYIGPSLIFELETRHLVSYKMVVADSKDRSQSPLPKSVWVGRTGQRVFEFKPMANIEIYPAKLAESATASHVEKHTPVPRAKPAAAPAKQEKAAKIQPKYC